MDVDVPGFLERFVSFGAAPSVETYLPAFHPDATLFDSGMERPITVPEIPEHIEGILKLAVGFRMTPQRWRERDGTIFVEARNEATLVGSHAEWYSIYCIDLRGDRVIRGRRYYDRQPLYARLNPELPSVPGLGTAPVSPGGSELVRLLPDAKLEVEKRAGDDALAFAEWRLSATIGGEPFSMGGADRIDPPRGDNRGHAYFDTLALATRLAEAQENA